MPFGAATRAQRRSMGRRKAKQECRSDVERVIELSGSGISPKAIASSTGLSVELVNLILKLAAEAESQSGGGG